MQGAIPASVLFSLFLSACEPELLRQQAERIRQQQEEIVRQRQEIQELTAAQQREDQRRENCNRAFREFEKAQAVKDPREAVSLYREGLKLCPDDDVAHYELGKIFREMGQREAAKAEFEAALRINPNFLDAKRQLKDIQGKVQNGK